MNHKYVTASDLQEGSHQMMKFMALLVQFGVIQREFSLHSGVLTRQYRPCAFWKTGEQEEEVLETVFSKTKGK